MLTTDDLSTLGTFRLMGIYIYIYIYIYVYVVIYSQVLLNEYFERVLVLQDHFAVHAEEVFTLFVLSTQISGIRTEFT